MPPASNVPKQQQKQIQEAEELHARYYGTPDTPPVEAPPVDPSLAVVPPVETPPVETPPVDPAPVVPPVETPPVELDAAGGDYDKLLQMHRTLQGKYDAEGGRANEQVTGLMGRVHELEQMLANPAPVTPATPANPAAPTQASLLTAQEVEDYGQDMIDVVKRAAREEVGQELDTLRAENENLKTQVGGVQQTTAVTARQTMLNYLDGELSGWRQINTEPVFVQWAEDIDTFSGQRRIDMLRAAFEQNNGPRVLAFFRGFTTENAAFQTQSQIEPARQPQVDLNSLVAPGRASDGDAPRAPEGNKPTYSQADIQQFYANVNRGVYKSDPAEKDRIERDIFAAQSDGRITA